MCWSRPKRRFDRKLDRSNLKTGWCCMIAFLSCLNFALPILRPILRPCLSLPMLVPQGYSALFVSILSGESKELITMMKARGTTAKKPQGWSPLGLYRHVIISFMTFWPCRTSSSIQHSFSVTWLLSNLHSYMTRAPCGRGDISFDIWHLKAMPSCLCVCLSVKKYWKTFQKPWVAKSLLFRVTLRFDLYHGVQCMPW